MEDMTKQINDMELVHQNQLSDLIKLKKKNPSKTEKIETRPSSVKGEDDIDDPDNVFVYQNVAQNYDLNCLKTTNVRE